MKKFFLILIIVLIGQPLYPGWINNLAQKAQDFGLGKIAVISTFIGIGSFGAWKLYNKYNENKVNQEIENYKLKLTNDFWKPLKSDKQDFISYTGNAYKCIISGNKKASCDIKFNFKYNKTNGYLTVQRSTEGMMEIKRNFYPKLEKYQIVLIEQPNQEVLLYKQ